MATWSEIREATLGKTYDLDKAYGGQCWDYVMYVLEEYYHGKRIHCTTSGYVKDIANNRKKNGILNYCTDVGLSATLKPGDICVWGECAAAPQSHIAIFDHDNGQNKAYFCGQNQAGGQKVTVERIDVSGIIGVFRPKKGLEKETSNKCPYKSSGSVEALYDAIRVRTSPSTSKGDTGSRYNKGMTLNYQSVVTGDGWYWAKYKSYDGETHYCALCKTDGTSKYWKQK